MICSFGGRAFLPLGGQLVLVADRPPQSHSVMWSLCQEGGVLGEVFSHVHGAGLDPRAGVDDPVHDGVGVDTATEPFLPGLFGLLGTEHCGSSVVASL